ncbi:MAG: hypothetical protein KDA96_09335, partial [Planctomycetaceae bacterium]|nr:hypothetical protein [Planctomycetaceae bacterium]
MGEPEDWRTIDDLMSPQVSPPHRNRAWVWVVVGLGGIVVLGGVMLLLGMALERLSGPGGVMGDTSERVSFNDPKTRADREYARDQFLATPENGPGVLALDEIQVQQALNQLTEVLSRRDEEQFEQLLDRSEFTRCVRRSGHLSVFALLGFQEEFSDWWSPEIPFTCSRQKLVRIERRDGMILAWCWPDHYAGPEPVVWYFVQANGHLVLADYLRLNHGVRESTRVAREFSAAYTEDPWDAYVRLVESESDETPDTEAELRQLAGAVVPKSIEHWALQNLASRAWQRDLHDLCFELCDRIEDTGYLPIIEWYRASSWMELKQFDKARLALQRSQGAVGISPRAMVMESEILFSLGQLDRSLDAGLKSLALYPETDYPPSTRFWDNLPPNRAEQFAAIAESSDTPEATAAQFIERMISNQRDDLAEPLLQIARSQPELAAVLSMEASLAEYEGDEESRIRFLRSATEAPDATDLQKTQWNSEWTWAMQMAGRGAEVIASSPDPVQSFYDLSFDEEVLTLSTKDLRSYTAALKSVPEQQVESVPRLRLWQTLATALLNRRDGKPDEALDGLLQVARERDSENIQSYADESLEWILEGSISELGVETGRLEEALEVLDGDPLVLFAWSAEFRRNGEQLRKILALPSAEGQNAGLRIYHQARLAELEGHHDQAIGAYRQFVKSAGEEFAYLQREAKRKITRDALDNGRLADLFAEPDEVMIELAGSYLLEQNDNAGMESLLTLADEHNVPFHTTIPVRCEYFAATGQMKRLCETFDRWRSESNMAGLEEWRLQDSVSEIIAALLSEERIDDARRLIEKLPSDYTRLRHEAWLAAGVNDENALRSALHELAYADGIVTEISQRLFCRLSAESVAKLQSEFPPGLSGLTGDRQPDEAVYQILLSQPSALTPERLKELVSDCVDAEDVSLADLTSVFVTARSDFHKAAGNEGVDEPRSSASAASDFQLFGISGAGYTMFVSHHSGPVMQSEEIESVDDSISRELQDQLGAARGLIQLSLWKDQSSSASREAVRGTGLSVTRIVKHLASAILREHA